MIGHPTTSARRIGPMLRKLRNDRGLTIARLAEQAGLSKGYISQIESGHKQPHWSTLMRLVHLLDERLCHLLAADGEEGARQVAKSEAKRPDDPTVEEEEVVVQFGVDRADCIPLAGNLPDEWGRVAGADEQGYTWILTPDPEARIVSEVLRVRIPAHAPWTPDRLQFAAPVVAYGLDNGPVKYYLYDRPKKSAKFLFSHRPELEKLAQQLLDKEVLLKSDVERLVGLRPVDAAAAAAKKKAKAILCSTPKNLNSVKEVL